MSFKEDARRFRTTRTHKILRSLVYAGWFYFRAWLGAGATYALVLFLSARGAEFSAAEFVFILFCFFAWIFEPALREADKEDTR